MANSLLFIGGPQRQPADFRYLRKCMKNWRAIAQAQGLPLSAGELDRIAPPLDALEEIFRPLVSDLTPDLEPCVEFSVESSASEEAE